MLIQWAHVLFHLWSPLEESDKVTEFLKLDVPNRLCEYVGYHVISGTVLKIDMTVGNSLVDKMEVYVNVFCMTMEGSVFG